MRLSLRFILPLIIALSLIAYALIPLVDQFTLNWAMRDLDIRSKLVANTMSETVISMTHDKKTDKLNLFFEKATLDDRLFALGFCSNAGELISQSVMFPQEIQCTKFPSPINSAPFHHKKGDLYVSYNPISDEYGVIGTLIVIHDMSYLSRRTSDTKEYLFYLIAGIGFIIAIITVVIAQLSWKGLISGLQALLKGEGIFSPMDSDTKPELRPLLKDLRTLIQDLDDDRRVRDESQMDWSPTTLKEILRRDLAGEEIIIVSNREPYIHTRKGDQIHVQVPASGLVTALEPVMRACSGTWIANGSGNADKEVVDKNDHVRVPPDDPCYQIRRIWLSKEEEQGFYYGFSNEGLWPLCHIAHTRPIFRAQDWVKYEEVNQKFAKAVVEESKTNNPVILIQDYHFALLPYMIKKQLPNSTIIQFWHIPWPNPEVFGICPWREELLQGMLGSDILGFHTRFHCNNFVDTVDRFLECRIDRETQTISYNKELTAINHYPISIEWPVRWLKTQKPIPACREIVRQIHGLSPNHKIGIGIDRLDYTKGILERFMAVDRFLETNPEWIGKFSFIQIGAPSRTEIIQYKRFAEDITALSETINKKYGKDDYLPIILKSEHHEPDRVYEYLRASDFCFISSLHDGMNLVAKEYIAAREDNLGVLLLSQFAGASKELHESLIVNPYNTEQCAEAIKIALEMPLIEQRDRMRNMRALICEFNIYRWAGKMLLDASHMRQKSRIFKRFKRR